MESQLISQPSITWCFLPGTWNLHSVLQALCGVRTPFLRGTFAAQISFQILSCCMCMCVCLFLASAPPISLDTASSVVLSYKPSAQLAFWWFSGLIVLQFSCNLGVIMGGGDFNFHLCQNF